MGGERGVMDDSKSFGLNPWINGKEGGLEERRKSKFCFELTDSQISIRYPNRWLETPAWRQVKRTGLEMEDQ